MAAVHAAFGKGFYVVVTTKLPLRNYYEDEYYEVTMKYYETTTKNLLNYYQRTTKLLRNCYYEITTTLLLILGAM